MLGYRLVRSKTVDFESTIQGSNPCTSATTMIKTDQQAYEAYPKDTHLYNKLLLSQQLGYVCGTDIIPRTAKWIVRPITNFEGMGRGAAIRQFKKGEQIAPDCFYCKVFTGKHITIDYTRKRGVWHQGATFQGTNSHNNLIQFVCWKRVNYPYPIPQILANVESDYINIELIDNKLIEVHLRLNPDPVMHDEFWPIWSHTQKPPNTNYRRIDDLDDETDLGRLGFFVPT